MNWMENNHNTSEKAENTATHLSPLVLPDHLKEETLAQLVLEVLVRKALVVDDTWSKWVLVSAIHVLKGNRAPMPCANCLGLKSSCGTCAPSSMASTFPGASMPIPERKDRYTLKQETKYQGKCALHEEVVDVKEDTGSFDDLWGRDSTVKQAGNYNCFDVKNDTVGDGIDFEMQQEESEVQDEVEMKDVMNRISSQVTNGSLHVTLQPDSEGDINHKQTFADARAKLRKILLNSSNAVLKSVNEVNGCDSQTKLHKQPFSTTSHGASCFPLTNARSDGPILSLSSTKPSDQLFVGTMKSVGVQCSPRLLGMILNQSVQVNMLKNKTQMIVENDLLDQRKSCYTQTNTEGVQGIVKIETKMQVDMEAQGMLGYHHDVRRYDFMGKSWELIPIFSHNTGSGNAQSKSRRKLAKSRSQWPSGSCVKEEPMFHGRPLVGKRDAHCSVNIPLIVDHSSLLPLDPRTVEQLI